VNLTIFTVVLDGMPFCQWHLPIFNRLKIPWNWIICHGTAQNNQSTSWCNPQKPRLSNDGTTEYLKSIRGDGITVIQKKNWHSKDEMVNAALVKLNEPCVLMEIDVDEIHTSENIQSIVELFSSDESLGMIRMPCRFFVGKDLVCEGENCWSNHKDYEWDRAWRFQPEIRFVTHEPPKLNRLLGRTMNQEESKKHGLTFDHFAYALPKQVEYKEAFYGYRGLVNQWRALQEYRQFPARLCRFFPFVDERTIVRRLDAEQIDKRFTQM
jgi:hypothetical protein